MKRRIFAALLGLCLIVSLLPSAAFAQDDVSYVALGDSITTGYGLGEDAQSFAEQVAAENGYSLTSLAADGATSSDLLVVVQAEGNAETLSNADIVTITIGGNDLMNALYAYLAAETDSTPEAVKTALESADATTLLSFADKIDGFAESTQYETALEALVANFDASIVALRGMNNDVSIVVINQYNPYSHLSSSFSSVIDAFESGLSELNDKLEYYSGIYYSVADVYTAFKGAEQNPCNAEVSLESVNLDFHPNAYGHTLIAETVNSVLRDISMPVDSLYINGTDLLAADNYTAECGTGRAVYNPDTNTLTLENAAITGEATQWTDTTAGISVDGGLNIALVGENTIDVDGENSLGIYANEGLSISSAANSSLEITSGGTGIWTNGELSISGAANSYLEITSGGTGIYHGSSNLTVTDCTLTIEAAEDGMNSNGGTGEVVTQISGSNVTVNSAGGSAIWNIYVSISDSTVYASGGGYGICATNELTITDSTVVARSTGANPNFSFYVGLRAFSELRISGDSDVTATAQGENGKICCGVFGRNVTLERGSTLTAESEQDAVRANNSITVPDGYLPSGYSVRRVINTILEDKYIYTIAEYGADVTYGSESNTDIITGAAGSITLAEPKTELPSGGQGSVPPSNTETERHPDGSVTTTETRPDGTVITTVTDPDGNKTRTTEKPDGSSTIDVSLTDGSGSSTTVDSSGVSETVATLSQRAVERGQAEAVTLAMPEVSAAAGVESAPTVTLDLPEDTTVRLEIPVANVTPGTVAVLVKADGTSEIVKTSVATDSGVALAMSGGETVKLIDNTKSFADVPDSFWGAEAVAFAGSRELLTGTGAAEFSPNVPMTRAMILTVLARLDGVDTSEGGTWYEAGAAWAVENGISDGAGLEQDLTREQLAAMLYRYVWYKGLDASAGEDTNILSYGDAFEISEYAIEAMQWACGAGIIYGTGESELSPQGGATRAQVAAMLMRFCLQAVM